MRARSRQQEPAHLPFGSWTCALYGLVRVIPLSVYADSTTLIQYPVAPRAPYQERPLLGTASSAIGLWTSLSTLSVLVHLVNLITFADPRVNIELGFNLGDKQNINLY